MQTQELRTETRHDWKVPKKERILLGRVVDKKTGTVIIPGTPVKGKLATFHPLHGHLKSIVAAKIPVENVGFYYKKMKLKTALQKGHYQVQADNKTKKKVTEKLATHIEAIKK